MTTTSRRARARSEQSMRLAVCAGRTGRLCHATHVFLQHGQLTASADQHGVTVTRQPADLPYMEHPAYDDNPTQVLELTRSQMRAACTVQASELSDDISDLDHRMRVAAAAIAQHHLTFLRVTCPGGVVLFGTRASVTAQAPVKGRFFTRTRTIAHTPLRGLL